MLKDDTTWDHSETEMQKRGVALPDSAHPLDLCLMTPWDIDNARKITYAVCANLLDHLGGYFCLNYDERLYAGLQDGKKYTYRSWIEADISVANDVNQQEKLSSRASWIIRHIWFDSNVSIYSLGSLCAMFYAPSIIPKRMFDSASATWTNVLRVCQIDNVKHSEAFAKALIHLSGHGFQRYYNFSTDNSKHYKQNRHMEVMTTFDSYSIGDWSNTAFVHSTYRLLTAGVNTISSSNTAINANGLIEQLGLRCAVYLSGCTTDNANGTTCESVTTYGAVMDRVVQIDDPNIKELTHINGVRWHAIIVDDPFYISSLVVVYASRGMSGDTENAEHMQIHYRQTTMMTFHSVHTEDLGYFQCVLDWVIVCRRRVAIQIWRERQHRWLVNQQFSRQVPNYQISLSYRANDNGVSWTAFCWVFVLYARKFNQAREGFWTRQANQISKRHLFDVPIVLLDMCNHTRIPTFLQTVLAVLYIYASKVDTMTLTREAGDDSK